jgi:hypothetical protein
MSLPFNKFPFFAPTDILGTAQSGIVSGTGVGKPTGGATSGMGKEDIIDFLSQDDDKPEIIQLDDKKEKKDEKPEEVDEGLEERTDKSEKGKETDEEEKEPEIDELAELEEELAEPTDEQLEITTPVRRGEILAKYPNLFKEFPYLEKAYYREQQYTKHFPTPADAEEALAKVQTLDRFEQDLSQGNTETILKAVKSSDPKSFNKVVDDYLPTLAKVDSDAYHHVIGNVIKHTIASMVATKNEALTSAAHLLNQYVFASDTFTPPTKLSREERDNPQVNELEQKQAAFQKQRLDSTTSELNSRVNGVYKATIEAHIDPKNSMTDYIKRNAIKDSQEMLNSLISRDTRFKSLVDKLWEKAIESDFNKESIDRIRRAYISKAQTLLPSVIKKARNEALKGMGKRVSKEEDDNTERETKVTKDKEESPRSRSNTNSGRKGEIPRGMSSLEYLMQD